MSDNKTPTQARAPKRGRRLRGRPVRGRGPQLSREVVVTEALRIIDEEGFDKLAMRTLAARFNVASNSLYTYVRDKDDLLSGVFDRVMEDLTLVDDRARPWAEQAAALCLACRTRLLAHPNVVSSVGFRETFPFSYVSWITRMGSILARGGFAANQLIEAIFALFYFTVGFVSLEVARENWGIRTRSDEWVLGQAGVVQDAEQNENAHELLSLVREVDLERVFRSSLDSVLKGLDSSRQT